MKNKNELRLYKREWSRKHNGVTKESLSNSCTWRGRRAEMIALQVLEGSVDMNKKAMNKPYDIEWNGLKIDVKSSNLYKRKLKRGKPVKKCCGWWVFHKATTDSDKYFCMCMIDNIPIRYYLIPKDTFRNGITIGWKSKKFDKYLLTKTL